MTQIKAVPYIERDLWPASILGIHRLSYFKQPYNSITVLPNGSVSPFVVPYDISCCLFDSASFFIWGWLCDCIAQCLGQTRHHGGVITSEIIKLDSLSYPVILFRVPSSAYEDLLIELFAVFQMEERSPLFNNPTLSTQLKKIESSLKDLQIENHQV